MNLNIFNNYINKISKTRKFSHAYLIELDNYDADFVHILNFVKLILCPKKCTSVDSLNCCDCNVCNLVDQLIYPDIKIIKADGNYIKKQQIIDLQNDFKNKSLLNNKKIYIIMESEKMNASAANTLLKFLEEPENDVIAILLTSNRYLNLDTVISRCQNFSLKKEKNNFIFDDNYNNFLTFLLSKDKLFINYKYIVGNILLDKETIFNYFEQTEKLFLYYIRNKDNFDIDLNQTIINLLKNMSIEEISRYIYLIENELKKLYYNINIKLWLDSFFAKIVGGIYD